MSSGSSTAAPATAPKSGTDPFSLSSSGDPAPFESGPVANAEGARGEVACAAPSFLEKVASAWQPGTGSPLSREQAASLFGHYADAKPANQSRPHHDPPRGAVERFLREPPWLREGAQALRSALKNRSLDAAVRILNQPPERVRAICDIYDSELSLDGDSLRADIAARLHGNEAEVLSALLTRADAATSQDRTAYIRQTARGRYEKHQAIVAHPAVRVAVPGTQVRYSVAYDSALSSEGSHTTYQWLCLNDPQTSQSRGMPAIIWGPQSASWDARWAFPGNHKLVCRVQSHFKEADGSLTTHPPEYVEYQQTVAEQGDVLAQALDKVPVRAAPEQQLRFLQTYQHALRSAEQRPGSGKVAPGTHEALDLRIAKLGDRLHSTEGHTRHPIKAVHVDAERAKVSPLNAFIAQTAVGNGQETWTLVDITNPTDRRLTGEYKGTGKDAQHAIQSAIAAWDSGNRYPKGRLRVKVPQAVGAAIDSEFQTDGMGFWDSISEFFSQVGFWTGIGMLGAAVAAAIAPDPTISKVAAALLWTSILTGATGTSIGMIKRHAEHMSTLREDAMDSLSLAGNALGAGWAVGATVRGLGFAGSRMGTAIAIGRFGTDGAQGILLAAEHLKEYQQILADPDPQRRTDRMIKLLGSAALSGGLLTLSIVGDRADLARGAAQRANLAKLQNAGELIDLAPPHAGAGDAHVDPYATTQPEIHARPGAAPTPEQQAPAPKGQHGAESQSTSPAEHQSAAGTKESKPWVTEPVPGLFDSIDATENVAPPGWRFHDEKIPRSDGRVTIVTSCRDAKGNKGQLIRTYDPESRTYVMVSAMFDAELDRWIHAGVPMISGKGTPLISYLMLRQLKLVGVGYGALQTVKMSTIQNIEAILQLAALRKTEPDLNKAVRATHSVRYAETALVQSGHRVVAARIVPPREPEPFDVLLEFRETHGRRIFQRDPDIVAKHDKLLAEYGVKRTDDVLWNYDIYLDLAPF
jgi:hypothetical protein